MAENIIYMVTALLIVAIAFVPLSAPDDDGREGR